MGKTATVFVLDVGRSMGEASSVAQNHESKLALAIDAARRIIHPLIMAGRKSDLVGVVLAGTDDTKNQLADEREGEYPHVTELYPLEQPRVQLLHDLCNVRASGQRNSDCLGALIVAVDSIARKTRGKNGKPLAFTRKVYLFTDGASHIDWDGVEAFAGGIVANQVQVSVVGIDFDPAIAEFDSEEGEEEEDVDAEEPEPPEGDGKIVNAFYWSKLTRRLLRSTYSNVFSLQDVLDELHRPQRKPITPVTIFRCDLTIGDSYYRIPVYVYNRVMEVKLPTAKKIITRSQSAADSQMKEEMVRLRQERTYRVVESRETPGRGDEKGDTVVSMFNHGEDTPTKPAAPKANISSETASRGESSISPAARKKPKLGHEVSLEETSLAYKYGTTTVPMAKINTDLDTHKGITILGFFDQDDVPRHHFMSNTMVIVPATGDHSAERLMLALISAMLETSTVARVEYVKRDGGEPKLGLLIPYLKPGKYQCFHLVQMPYADDLREYNFRGLPIDESEPSWKNLPPSIQAMKPTAEQMDAMADFMGKMMLPEVDAEGEPVKHLKPRHTYNPVLHHVNRCIEQRALYPESALPEIGDDLMKAVSVPESLLKHDFTQLKEAFPLRQVPKKTARKDAQDTGSTAVVAALEQMLAAERAEELATFTERMRKAEDPWIVYQELHDKPGDYKREAVAMVAARIQKDAMESNGSPSTILTSVQRLRDICIQAHTPSYFNDLMRDVVNGEIADGRLLRMLVDSDVSLITALESDKSTVGAEEARVLMASLRQTAAAANIEKEVDEEGAGLTEDEDEDEG